MKSILFILPMLLCLSGYSQQTDSSFFHRENSTQTNFLKANNTTQHVVQYMGMHYNSTQLMRMPVRNINKIAATVAGVESRNGETPIIRGAIGGTAYFIDGVRVYNMPSLFLFP